MARAAPTAHRRWLLKIARETARERLRRAREAVRDARAAKRTAVSRARTACTEARQAFREWLARERSRVQLEIARLRGELKRDVAARREAVAKCCGPDKAQARTEGNERIERVRAELAQLLEERRRERTWAGSGKGKRPPSSRPAREQREQSDHEVEVNLSEDQRIVWDAVKAKIHATGRMSRTETFQHWLHEHPADAARILQAHADRAVAEAVREERRAQKALDKLPATEAGLRSMVAEELAATRTPLSLEQFAAKVRELADTSPRVERFHDRAFIRSVYDAADWAENFEQYKQRLLEAHRAGLVRLTRADLVGAMDVNMVEASELRYLGATFHLIAMHEPRTAAARTTAPRIEPPDRTPAPSRSAGKSHERSIKRRPPKPRWHEPEAAALPEKRFNAAGLRDAEDIGLQQAATPLEVRRNVLEYVEAHGPHHPYDVINVLLDYEDDHNPGGRGWRMVGRRLNLANDDAIRMSYEAMQPIVDMGTKLSREKVLAKLRKQLDKAPKAKQGKDRWGVYPHMVVGEGETPDRSHSSGEGYVVLEVNSAVGAYANVSPLETHATTKKAEKAALARAKREKRRGVVDLFPSFFVRGEMGSSGATTLRQARERAKSASRFGRTVRIEMGSPTAPTYRETWTDEEHVPDALDTVPF